MSSWLDLVVEGKESSPTLVDIPPWYPNLQQLVLQGCTTDSTPTELVKVHIEGIDSDRLEST